MSFVYLNRGFGNPCDRWQGFRIGWGLGFLWIDLICVVFVGLRFVAVYLLIRMWLNLGIECCDLLL